MGKPPDGDSEHAEEVFVVTGGKAGRVSDVQTSLIRVLDPQAFIQPTSHPYHLLGLSLRPLLCFLLSLLTIISLHFL